MTINLEVSILRLQSYIESEKYKGYDPYDALTSGIFRSSLFTNSMVKFGVQQIVKRSPINLRPLLGIKKGLNPVTLGLCIQAYSRLYESDIENRPSTIPKIRWLIDKLKTLIPQSYNSNCWGYDFPWQARYAKIPAYQPTVVATGIIVNALFICYKTTGITEAMELCKGSADFVSKSLNRTYEGDTLCFSYSPFDHQQVYNASAKGMRLLAQVYSLTGIEEYKELAAKASKYIINHQRPDGSWYYSNVGSWIDNYHTGYVLDCLDEYEHLTGDTSIHNDIQKGYAFYRNNFITEEGIPKLRFDQIYPVDCTSAGQTLLTLCRFKDYKAARIVSEWICKYMQSEKGFFFYRKNRFFTQKTSFMRWSNAWMFSGLAEVVSQKNKNSDGIK